jgi:glycosyltransferase involved in cell wall biosynthesis
MKTIVMTAYAINPFKGSEDGMGWNFVLQAANENKVVAITRKNNGPHIHKYMQANPDARYANIQFEYKDWPQWMLFWKKGPILSLIYYYFWQIMVALHVKRHWSQCDVVHNVNFHNDWTPSFLWITGKPLVWGPVGHHPKIDRQHLLFYGRKAWLSDRFLWVLKNVFWKLDPFLKITKRRAQHVFCMNSEAPQVLKLQKGKYSIMPSVATESVSAHVEKQGFTIISAGRFVPLKGFDMTIISFAKFYHGLPMQDRKVVKLKLVGQGPFEKKLKQLAIDYNVAQQVEFVSWIERTALQELYAASSVYLFPSYEGAGMVVAEAMMHGLPVVCWDNAGPGEFVPEKSELRVSLNCSRDYASQLFAGKLHALYYNKILLANESKMAKERYASTFTWERRGEELARVYRSLQQEPQVVPTSKLNPAF